MQGSIIETLHWCRPTIFFTVPRVWEKFEDTLKEKAAAAPEIFKKFSAWAKGHGYAKVMGQTRGEMPGFGYRMARALLLNKIKGALGFDECVFFFYGAAPLKKSSVEYFA